MNDIAEVFKNMNEVYATAAAEGARSVATALQHVIRENAEIRELIIEGLFDDCREDWAGKPTLDLVKDLLRRHNWAVDHSSSAMKWQRDELRAALEAVVAIGPAYWGTRAEQIYENARAVIARLPSVDAD